MCIRMSKLGILSGLYGMENSLKAGNGERKMENRMENRPELDRGNNGQKMDFRGIFHFFSIFWAIFAPVKLGAVFHSVFHFSFPISGFQAVFHPVQARQDPKFRHLYYNYHLTFLLRSSDEIVSTPMKIESFL